MKWRRKMFAAVSSLAVLSAALLAGCGQAPEQETAGTSLSEGGTLLLSVNPEIQIDYNKEGHVTALSGKNEDGKSIVAGYPDYVGERMRRCAGRFDCSHQRCRLFYRRY